MPSWGVQSEVGRLRKVLVHRPGREHRWTLPWNKDVLLFDDVLDTEEARDEHEEFTNKMVNQGVDVLYVMDLLRKVCSNPLKTEELYRDVLDKEELERVGEKRLMTLTPEHLICGFPDNFPLKDDNVVLFPSPNLYFMRDPGFAVPGALVVSSPCKKPRRRESRLISAIFDRHEDFRGQQVYDKILWEAEATEDEKKKPFIEGGDVHVVDSATVIIGIGERTNDLGAERLIRFLFDETPVERVLKIFLPSKREFMHLDTVMTFVDRGRILTMPHLWDKPDLYTQVYRQARLQREHFAEKERCTCNCSCSKHKEEKEEDFVSRMELIVRGTDHMPRKERVFDNVLQGLHDLGIIDRDRTIYVAGNDLYPTEQDHVMAALREQWSDAANTLALSPGKVVAYNRNDQTFRSLEGAGLDVVKIRGGELVRGRGGTRCMTMPIIRDDA
jgi:arginine deiminase